MNGDAVDERAARALRSLDFRFRSRSGACATAARLRDNLSRSNRRSRRSVFFVAMMEFENLGLGEIRRRSFSELHHEHRTRREVRRVEQARALRCERRELPKPFVRQARGSDDAINVMRQGDCQIIRNDIRLREVDEHIEIAVLDRVGHGSENRETRPVLSERVDAASYFHIGSGADRLHDRRAHASCAARNSDFYHRITS